MKAGHYFNIILIISHVMMVIWACVHHGIGRRQTAHSTTVTLCEICTVFKVGRRQDRVVGWRIYSNTWNVGNKDHVEEASCNRKG